jgi:hypothetical protein
VKSFLRGRLGAGCDSDARHSVEPMTLLQLGVFLEYFSLADFPLVIGVGERIGDLPLVKNCAEMGEA